MFSIAFDPVVECGYIMICPVSIRVISATVPCSCACHGTACV